MVRGLILGEIDKTPEASGAWPGSANRPSGEGRQAGVPSAAGRHIGPLIPPSFRTRQKWIMISKDTASGIATQCST